MKRIGILSDTHGLLSEELQNFFIECDEIWHAGDVGNYKIIEKMYSYKKIVRGVYGNIDDVEVRKVFPKFLFFECEKLKVFITHIGGYPGHYPVEIKKQLYDLKPDIFVCGHSHILRIIYDNNFKFLCINPGAAGKEGFHKVQTAVRFELCDKAIEKLEIWEKKR